MLFNPGPTKQAKEVCFSLKCGNVPHEPFTFNITKYNVHLLRNIWDLF